MNINEIETKLSLIKKQSDLRTKYLTLIEKELEKDDIKGFAKNKKIRKLELEIEKCKK